MNLISIVDSRTQIKPKIVKNTMRRIKMGIMQQNFVIDQSLDISVRHEVGKFHVEQGDQQQASRFILM